MKKLLLAVCCLFALSPLTFAEGFGAAVKVGVGQNDPKGLNNLQDDAGRSAVSSELTENPAFLGAEGFYEFDLDGETNEITGSVNKIGVKLGFDYYMNNKLKLWIPNDTTEIKEKTWAIPLTVYYKYDKGIENFSFYGGLGATFIRTKWDSSGNDSANASKNKIFPHIAAGAEYRFSEQFGLGLDLRYNFSAKVEKDDIVLSNHSGINGAVSAKIYF